MVDIPARSEEAQAAEVTTSSRETTGEILAPNGTEEQRVINLPTPVGKYQPMWDPLNATSITEKDRSANDDQTKHYFLGADSTVNKISAPAEQPRSTRSNSDDAAFYDASEEQPGQIDPILTSSVIEEHTMQSSVDTEASAQPPTSMMNRPRGASLEQAAIFDQPSQPTIRSVQAPLSIQSTSQDIVGLEEQGKQPSFKGLPPIRRTSKFGFEFGSRRPQPRFPISDDEDEDGSTGHVQDVIKSNTMATNIKDSTSQQNSDGDALIGGHVRDPQLNAPTNAAPRFSVFPRVSDPFVHNDNHSSDAWRSNLAVRHTRQASWDNSLNNPRSRQGSSSDQQLAQGRGNNAPQQLAPALPFEQPPSSAQRYPELFGGPAVEIGDDLDMPSRYYQAPIGRTEAFLPRQQTSEYEIPGVGPPQNAQGSIGHRSRRSSDLVNKGMNFVRSISRERKGSVSRDEAISPIDTSTSPPSRGDRQQRRGSGFWGNFDITGGQSLSSPVGRESMVAHYSGSQSNLMASPYDSPMTPKATFNPTFILETPRSNIIGRSTTTMGKGDQREEKKSRLSGLSGLFSRSPKGNGSVLFKPKRATTDLSNYSPRDGTLSSPQFETRTPQDTNVDYKRRPSQPMNFLSKFTPSTSFQKNESPRQDSKPHQEPRPRRPSVSGLLTGMIRKRSNTLDKESERSDDDGRRPVIIPAARMYSDLSAESHEVLPDPVATPTQRLKKRDQDRGRARSSSKLNGSKQEHPHSHSHHNSRRHGTLHPQVPEPQYNSVPIPGGYNLVRGDGTTAAPTNYDPRGINHPRHASLGNTLSNPSQHYSVPSPVSPLTHSGSSISHPLPSLHQTRTPERRHPNLPSIDTHTSSFTSPVHTHHPSHEDILARSSAREQPGQQRPFQLTLPHVSNANNQSSHSSTPPIPPPKDDPVPPRSPNAIPLPADAFSPLNENIDIDRFPLPPSPPQQSPEWHRNRNLSVATDDGLQRSGTGRSLVSAVSQISDSPSPQPPAENVEHVLHVAGDDNRKRDSGDLYDASPRLSRHDMAEKYTERKKDMEIGTDATRGTRLAGENGEKLNDEGTPKETAFAYARKEREGLQMSATSYPGMEWNPYAGGNMGREE